LLSEIGNPGSHVDASLPPVLRDNGPGASDKENAPLKEGFAERNSGVALPRAKSEATAQAIVSF